MTYSEKLKDPRWQRRRLEIFTRDQWTCLCCGSKDKPLSVHHLVYRKLEPWDYPEHLYQTLCEDCHEIRQELTDKIVDGIRIALKDVPTRRLETVAKRICSEAMSELAT